MYDSQKIYVSYVRNKLSRSSNALKITKMGLSKVRLEQGKQCHYCAQH